MQLKELLTEHSRHSGVALNVDDQGICHLLVNGEFVVNLEMGDSDNLFFYSHIALLPDTENEEIFRNLLKANLYTKRTQGSIFALDEHGTEIILFREAACDNLDFDAYYKYLQTFVSQIAYWKEEIQKTMSSKGVIPKMEAPKSNAGTWIKI